MADFSETICEFAVGVRPSDLPVTVVERGTDALADTWGVLLAGARDDVAERTYAALRAISPTGDTYAAGRAAGLSVTDAALYNGTAAHALDYDDTVLAARSHVTSHLLPTLISAATLRDGDGTEALVAYAVGAEVEARLGRVLDMRDRAPRGWHPTGVLGTYGSTVTASRALGLDAGQMRQALGLASSMAAGARLNIGTMAKPMHSGFAARNGVLAASLAREGMTASGRTLDDEEWGMLAELAGSPVDLTAGTRGLSEEWAMVGDLGLALKAYPSCARTHAAIDACGSLSREMAARGDRAARVTVHVTTATTRMLRYPAPATPLEAKFSMHFCVAAALSGRVGIATFTQEVVDDPAVRRLAALVELVSDRPPEDDDGVVIRIVAESDTVYTRQVAHAYGWPDRWLPAEHVRAKFLDCCAAGGVDAAEAVYDEVRGMTSTASVRSTVSTIAGLTTNAVPTTAPETPRG
jgi:2-methylcitrate dehydratase PrpD